MNTKKNKKPIILIIDDEESIRDSCTQVLAKEGYSVDTSSDGRKALKVLNKSHFDVVLLDLKLPGVPGIKILKEIKKSFPEVPVIIITGFASIESAVKTIKQGAFDYLAKPFSPEELRTVVKKALDNRKAKDAQKESAINTHDELSMVVGQSKAMSKVIDIMKRVSPTESTVLITGESGTGKELLATEMHKHSLRKEAPFVVVDCGTLVETLFESELFGHVKGSFTGAHETKHGRFEVADGGTIFLDEISNISMNIQAKLLRVIQEREVTRIGSTKPIKVDVRILAATNVSLAKRVKQNQFREDLFYRLSVVPINIPPLRERKEDIPPLLNHFLNKYNQKLSKDIQGFTRDAEKAIMNHDWPGNIRELENTIERAVVLTRSQKIGLQGLIYHGIGASRSMAHPVGGRFKSLEKMEKEYIESVLKSQHGNKSKTARILGIDRKTLYSKIKKYKIS
ncbi:MAG: response regulator [Candidatus Aminicenantes bacterium]|nr:response regulator [Candidatus Aminicenantes bacterium]